ncbi:putative D-amino-acid oxidase [[Candida] railenensis]|uniref:D-amino-acid oxidase n=1 Tax=[Candida] railenensis TaxID=45579 RepID=A0A9P0VZX1_9ASCO|nr:putative D-amino-acid oxidase [[Candida] railenensis]
MVEHVVIGCGIIGLYTVFGLLEKGIDPKTIAIIAEHHPGDLSINYASPVAGAYFSASADLKLLKYSNYTYQNLVKLETLLGPKCGLGHCTSTEILDDLEVESDPYLNAIGENIDDFEILSPEEIEIISKGSRCAIRYKAWIFNSPVLLEKLCKYYKSIGVAFQRTRLESIHDAFDSDTKVVFNCTGNGSRLLGGVEDEKVFPTRGQVVVIKGPHIDQCISRWNDEATYIIKRPDSASDEVILGGYYQPYQPKKDTADTYGFETESILKRTTEMFPDLLKKNPFGDKIEDLQILRVIAGARPCRECGVRIEKELIAPNKLVIHNYGASGNGYMCGLGMAHEAVSLLD